MSTAPNPHQIVAYERDHPDGEGLEWSIGITTRNWWALKTLEEVLQVRIHVVVLDPFGDRDLPEQ